MPNVRRRIFHIVWIFPLAVVLLLGLIHEPDAARLSDLLIQRTAEHYGVPLEKVRRYLESLPSGLSLASLEPPSPHEHHWPAGLSIFDSGVEMVFAHLGTGSIGNTGRFLQTTLHLANDSNQDAKGTIAFFDNDGNPLELPVGGTPVTEIDFELRQREVRRFVTDGPGQVKSGWALVHSDQPLSGTLSFAIRDGAGNVFSDVGVTPSRLSDEITIFADSIANSDTGVGISNPNDQPLTLLFDLLHLNGDLVSSEQRILAGRGHLALFLTELFPGVAGIGEFEGSLVIRAENGNAQVAEVVAGGAAAPLNFAAVTLRVTGELFTSLPAVLPPPPGASWTNLAFPHLAVGKGGGLEILTSTILFNNTGNIVTGNIEFFKSDSTPLEVTVDGVSGIAFDFMIDPGGVLRLVADADGGIETGWARVSMDQPIIGTTLFTILDSTGSVVAEVGVPSAILQRRFNLLADSTEGFDTGIAMAFPLVPEDDEERKEEEATVNVQLFRADGVFVASTEVRLKALHHTALFMTQLFSEVEGIGEFEGFMKFSSDQLVAPLSLRTAGAKVTSVPIFDELHGFAPVSDFLLTQNLAGTAPPIHWLLHQNEDDLVLDQIRVFLANVELESDSVAQGEFFAVGTFVQRQGNTSRLAQLVVEKKGSIEFDLVILHEEGLFSQGTGTFAEENGGVQVELDLVSEENSFIGADADWMFHLPPGLFRLPENANSISVQAEFVSVAAPASGLGPIVRKTEEEVVLLSASNQGPNVTRTSPQFPLPNRRLTLHGSNLAEVQEVVLPTRQGEVRLFPIELADDQLTTLVPQNFQDGEIGVETSNFSSNRILVKTFFAPVLEAAFVSEATEQGSESGVEFLLQQDMEQFPLETFELQVSGLTPDFFGVSEGDSLGKVERTESGTELELFVASVSEDNVMLEMKFDAESDPEAVMKLSQTEQGLQVAFVPSELELNPSLLTTDVALKVFLKEILFQNVEEGAIFSVSATLRSVTTQEGGESDPEEVQLHTFLFYE